jgi:phage terminase small subunit
VTQLTRDEIISALVKNGAGRDRATVYADSFLDYREATANIAEHGVIVQHPRTGNPIENPYVAIRDRAAAKLSKLRGVRAEFLW